MYYVCNNPEPMEAPSIPARLYALQSEAFSYALSQAKLYPERPAYYVHRFAPSTVIFKAFATITVDSEHLQREFAPEGMNDEED